ncbi:MAG: Glycosyltransferase AglE [Candidatus Woesearchaeota archaeon]|nr:Glycosyltransferase AglE [Candidatus Woesearchaeota archaeon]
MNKVSIIIPTYNEVENIEKLIRKIRKIIDAEIIVIDDSSPDGTYELAKQVADKAILRRKRGLATAVIEGFEHASGKIIVVMDADLSHPPELIPKLVNALLVHKLAIGTRTQTRNWGWSRKITSHIATLLARPLTNAKDPMSGFFAIKKSDIPKNLAPLGYKILLEILVKSGIKDYAQIAFVFYNRQRGKSKIGFRTNINYLKHIKRLYFYKIRKNILNF